MLIQEQRSICLEHCEGVTNEHYETAKSKKGEKEKKVFHEYFPIIRYTDHDWNENYQIFMNWHADSITKVHPLVLLKEYFSRNADREER